MRQNRRAHGLPSHLRQIAFTGLDEPGKLGWPYSRSVPDFRHANPATIDVALQSAHTDLKKIGGIRPSEKAVYRLGGDVQ